MKRFLTKLLAYAAMFTGLVLAGVIRVLGQKNPNIDFWVALIVLAVAAVWCLRWLRQQKQRNMQREIDDE